MLVGDWPGIGQWSGPSHECGPRGAARSRGSSLGVREDRGAPPWRRGFLFRSTWFPGQTAGVSRLGPSGPTRLSVLIARSGGFSAGVAGDSCLAYRFSHSRSVRPSTPYLAIGAPLVLRSRRFDKVGRYSDAYYRPLTRALHTTDSRRARTLSSRPHSDQRVRVLEVGRTQGRTIRATDRRREPRVRLSSTIRGSGSRQ